jgi:hypothetical protein
MMSWFAVSCVRCREFDVVRSVVEAAAAVIFPVKVGDMENTANPAVPVSSLKSDASIADDCIDDDASFAENIVKSAAARHPGTDAVAVVQVTALVAAV